LKDIFTNTVACLSCAFAAWIFGEVVRPRLFIDLHNVPRSCFKSAIIGARCSAGPRYSITVAISDSSLLAVSVGSFGSTFGARSSVLNLLLTNQLIIPNRKATLTIVG
jgi:hypothetical protein